jgi:general nucleoside transport system permease protein
MAAVRLERRLDAPLWRRIVVPILSVLAALATGAVFLVLTDHDPGVVYREMFEAAFTTRFGITDTLAVATPLVLTALAAAVTFRMGLYNIGAEGQLYAGAIAASWAGLALAPSLPGPVAVAAVLVAGALGGALWIVIPALARAWLNASEIITSLLLTFVALYLMRYLIFGSSSYWKDPASTNFPQGKRIDEVAFFPLWDDTRVHLGLVVAVVVAVLLWVLVTRTSFGFDMRVLGDSPAAARYAGIPIRRTIVVVMLVSGALAGLAGASEVGGTAHALDPNGIAVNYGFAGIVVAALARYNPIGCLLVAALLGGMQNAASTLQSLGTERVPIAISLMLQGAILLFALGGEVFVRYRLRVGSSPSAGSGDAVVLGDAPPATLTPEAV